MWSVRIIRMSVAQDKRHFLVGCGLWAVPLHAPPSGWTERVMLPLRSDGYLPTFIGARRFVPLTTDGFARHCNQFEISSVGCARTNHVDGLSEGHLLQTLMPRIVVTVARSEPGAIATKALEKEKKADECRAMRALAKDEKTGQCEQIPLHACGVAEVASASASSTAAAARPPGMWQLQRFPQPSMMELLYKMKDGPHTKNNMWPAARSKRRVGRCAIAWQE